MRRQKMIIFIGIPVLVLIIVLIFIDSWIERGLEKSGEALVGAKVEMDGFHISLFNGSTEWKRLQVTNPKNTMKNLFETGPVRFQLNPSALFKKRLLIQELSILNVAAGTHRSTDGALPARQHREVEKRKPTLFSKMKKRLVQDIESMPVLEWSNLTSTNLNVDSLVQAANLQVIPQVDSAQSQVQRISQKWESFSKTYRPNQDLKKLSETYQAIEIKKINSLPELIDLLQTVQTSSTELKAIQDTIQTKSREMQSDIHTIDRIRKNLPLWIESDYQHLLAKAKLPDLSPKNMGKILFGSAILKRVGFLLDILDLAERALPRKKPSHQKKIEISQQKKNKQNAPAFLIENLALSGRLPIHADTSYLTVKGEGTNLTTQPWIHKKATRLNLKGDDPTGQSVKLAAILNWIEDQNQDSLFIQLKKFPVQFRKSDSAKGFIPTIKQGFADVKIQVDTKGEYAKIHTDIMAHQLVYDFNSRSKNTMESRLRKILNRNPSVQLGIDFMVLNDQVAIAIRSSIDEMVSSELKRFLSESTLKLQKQIRSQLDHRTRKDQNSLTENLSKSQTRVKNIQSTYRKQLDEVLSVYEIKKEALEKEIEKREQKEKDKLEDKAKDLLDQIFNKKKKKKARKDTASTES